MERLKRLNLFPQEYQSLASDELVEDTGRCCSAAQSKITFVLYVIVIAVFAFAVGVFVGYKSSLTSIDAFDGFPGQLGHTPMTWQLNHTFAEKPSPESEAAWQSIIPEGRGFVSHPTLAPTNKSLSVFHELHCLHTLRVAYYISIHDNAVLANSSYTDPYLEAVKARTAVSHVQHCFDYIRQALMCAADTNFEQPAEASAGVTDGWGFERQCRDYWGVVEWAETWRNNEGWTILSAEGQEDGGDGGLE